MSDAGGALALIDADLGGERGDDVAHDLVLQLKQVVHFALDTFSPQMFVLRGIGQLDVDAHLAAVALDAAFQNEVDTELAAQRLGRGLLAAVGKMPSWDEITIRWANLERSVVRSLVTPSQK